jgi:glycosyltransferase involved in cell wall biosynthesis
MPTRVMTSSLINTASQKNRLENPRSGGFRLSGSKKASSVNSPLISIITVVLNAKKDIEKAIRSVAAQSYPNVELIIIDGGSTDGTLEILSKCNDIIDFWISENDGGIYYAMNKALAFSSGDWILYLGADDILINCLEQIAANLIDPKVIYYGDVYMNGFHRLYDGEFSEWKITNRNICHQAIFYPKQVFEFYQFNPHYKVYADHYLNIQCFTDKRFKFCYLPILVTLFNNGGFSAKNSDPAFAKAVKLLVKERCSVKIYYPFIMRKLFIDFVSFLGMKTTIKKILARFG